MLTMLCVGVVLGSVLYHFLWRHLPSPFAKPFTPPEVAILKAEVERLNAVLADVATAAEVEDNVLAVIEARGWSVSTSFDRYARLAYVSPFIDATTLRAMQKTWSVNGHESASLAKAWATACAYYNATKAAEAKVKEQFPDTPA